MSRLIRKDPEHIYLLDGKPIPSVTTIIKDAGMMPQYKPGSDAPAIRGRAVHQTISFYLAAKQAKTTPGDLDAWVEQLHPVVRPHFDAFRSWEAKARFRPEKWDLRVWDEAYWYAGELDMVGRINGSRSPRILLDIKTGAKAEWHRLQTAGYALAYGRPVGLRASLYCPAKGPARFELHASADDIHDFLSAVRTARWRNQHGLTERAN